MLDLYGGRWRGTPLGPDDRVLCGDEKTCLQVLRRLVPTRPPGPGRPGRYEHEYVRKGVLVYQGFLDVHDGKAVGQCVPRNTATHFRNLVRKVMRRKRYRTARRVFLILDNGSAHLPGLFSGWLRENVPNAVPVSFPCTGAGSTRRRFTTRSSRARCSPRGTSRVRTDWRRGSWGSNAGTTGRRGRSAGRSRGRTCGTC